MRTLAIVAGILLTVGVGWYLVAVDRGSADVEGSAAASSDEPGPRRRAKGSPRSSAFEPDEPRRDGSLEERVARLEDEVAMLRRQLALRGRVAMSGGGSSEPASIVDDPVLEEQVRDIYEEEREREREREREARRERFEEMRSEALDELASAAALSTEQRETIDGLWNDEADRMLPLFQAARSGERSRGEIREEIEAIRKEIDDAARAALSESQYEHYEELRPRGPGRRGGRDRGDRRGGEGRRGAAPGPE